MTPLLDTPNYGGEAGHTHYRAGARQELKHCVVDSSASCERAAVLLLLLPGEKRQDLGAVFDSHDPKATGPI